ncbi:MAG: DNA recombination protein RmuC [Bacteroidales bacterium]|nr:DNA recombination protein RmuC [Candidatus Cacconaster merdequi]
MDTLVIVVVTIAAVAVTWGLTYFTSVKKWKKEAEDKAGELNEYENRCIAAEKEMQSKLTLYEEKLRAAQSFSDERIRVLEEKLAEQKTAAADALAEEKKRSAESKEELRSNYEKTLEEIKKNHREALEKQGEAYDRQRDALRDEMMAKTEEILRKRQEELDRKAAETFENITGSLGKDLKDMKTAFEENKTKSSMDSATMKEKFESAVKHLEEQTRSIGAKADHLADAMRGQKKMQGCWGETILQNLLNAEGMEAGRDYDKEETLRDELGIVLLNEDTEKRMRPDYILHFVDNQDVVVDSKVSLSAFADYSEAETDVARSDAAARNLEAFREQVRKLAAKKYNEYLKPGRRMVTM